MRPGLVLWTLTLSKSLTLGKAQVNLALLSLNRDIGCVTPLYVYRMWGGVVALEEIEKAMKFCLPAGR